MPDILKFLLMIIILVSLLTLMYFRHVYVSTLCESGYVAVSSPSGGYVCIEGKKP